MAQRCAVALARCGGGLGGAGDSTAAAALAGSAYRRGHCQSVHGVDPSNDKRIAGCAEACGGAAGQAQSPPVAAGDVGDVTGTGCGGGG